MYRLQTIQQTDSHGDTFMTINIIDENARIIFRLSRLTTKTISKK